MGKWNLTTALYILSRGELILTAFLSSVIALNGHCGFNARLYEAVQKDYETFRQDMLEWRVALSHEWMVGEAVTPSGE